MTGKDMLDLQFVQFAVWLEGIVGGRGESKRTMGREGGGKNIQSMLKGLF